MCPGVPFSLLAVSLCTSYTWAVRSCIAVGGYDQVDPRLLVRRVVTVMIVDQNVSFSEDADAPTFAGIRALPVTPASGGSDMRVASDDEVLGFRVGDDDR